MKKIINKILTLLKFKNNMIKFVDLNVDPYHPLKKINKPKIAINGYKELVSYDISKGKDECYYVFSKSIYAIEEKTFNDYIIIVASEPFYDHYWKVKTKNEAVWLCKFFLSNKMHYQQLFNILSSSN